MPGKPSQNVQINYPDGTTRNIRAESAQVTHGTLSIYAPYLPGDNPNEPTQAYWEVLPVGTVVTVRAL